MTYLPPSVQYTTPTTGSTVNASVGSNVFLLINPAGTLVALTLALNGSPVNGDLLTISSTQIITGLTMSGGTIIGALTTMAVATFARYMYSSDASKWFRVG